MQIGHTPWELHRFSSNTLTSQQWNSDRRVQLQGALLLTGEEQADKADFTARLMSNLSITNIKSQCSAPFYYMLK
jgi:hypothetical protein